MVVGRCAGGDSSERGQSIGSDVYPSARGDYCGSVVVAGADAGAMGGAAWCFVGGGLDSV